LADSTASRDQRQDDQGHSASRSNGSEASISTRSTLEQQQTELDLDTGEAALRKAEASARHAEAKAETVEQQVEHVRYRAMAEPYRQATTQWERIVKLRLQVTKTWMLFWVTLLFLFAQAAVSIFTSGVYSLGLPIVYLGFVTRQLSGGDEQEREPQERSNDP
jgi:exonuclease VII small subunit